MKTISLFLSMVLFCVLGTNLSAQSGSKTPSGQKTETFKVWGKCDMCKERIETAVKSEGAKSASWDSKSQILTVTFDPAKTSLDAFGKKLASVGHDTEKFRASDEVYSKLPGCCHYDRAKK